tara:strand:+ start:35 stop:445 length:411 start_codon:yes stop_codon:yes gene_type:complete
MKKNKNIGVEGDTPKENCNDLNCPFHGNLKVKEVFLVGTVTSSKMPKSATIVIPRTHFIPKFERNEKRRTKIKVHNPTCINIKEGDIVKLAACRPISKTKNFVIIKKITHKIIVEKEDAFKKEKVKKNDSSKSQDS